MYKVELWYSDGSENTFFDNEQDTKEYMKVNRDSHMDIYFNDDLIYTVSTLLSHRFIDKLDFKSVIEKLQNKIAFTYNEWKRVNYGEFPSYLYDSNGDDIINGEDRIKNKYEEYLNGFKITL
jgi:hypothetical protein